MMPMPSCLRGARARDIHRLAVDANLAGVLLVDARQHFHQRRLAGAVLAHQRVHFAGQQLEPHVVSARTPGKDLLDILDSTRVTCQLSSINFRDQ